MDYLLGNFSHISPLLLVSISWSLRILALFIVPKDRSPVSGITWLMLIFLLPLPGWIAFLLIGNPKLPKSRRNLQTKADHYLEAIDEGESRASEAVDKKYKQVMELAEGLVHMPVTYCDRYEIIDDYDEVFRRLAHDIAGSKEAVYVNFYILGSDKSTTLVIDELIKAHQRGVNVYVLYDDYCRLKYRTWFEPLRERLETAGIPFVASLPIKLSIRHYLRPDLRNHRKIVTIDHNIFYTGSQNLIDKTYHRKDDIYYKELMVRMEGHIAKHAEIVFATDWQAETKESIFLLDPTPRRHNKSTNLRVQALPSGPGYSDENNLKVFIALLYAAEQSITIVSPYFVPDEALMMAIESAARRGVVVTMINSEVADQATVAHAQRSYYDQLLQAGVNIYLHKRPVLVHSKFIIVDEQVSAVGSSNMDMRSFMLDSELTLLIYGEQFATSLQAVADTYLSESRRIDKKAWRQRPAGQKLLDNLARLTSSLQ